MAKTDRTRPVVCDAGPLIHLDELDSLDLLQGFATVLITPAVWQEVRRHRPTALSRLPRSSEQREPEGVADERLTAIFETFGLGAGDREAVALVREVPGALLLTDDAAVRLVAEQLGIEARGTIGVIIRAIRHGTRTGLAALHTLETLPIRSSLYVRSGLLQEIIALVRQQVERAE